METFVSALAFMVMGSLLVAPAAAISIGAIKWSVDQDLPGWIAVPLALLVVFVYIAALVAGFEHFS